MNTRATSGKSARHLGTFVAACTAGVLFTLTPMAHAVQRVIDVAQPPAVPADLKGIQKAVQRAQDALQIQNLMSRRSFYHASGQQAAELELFAHRPDVSF